MTRVFNGERTFLSPILRPVEASLYWVGGVDERREQHWLTYTVAMLLFHVGGVLIIYGLMRLQAVLPFNPAGQSAVAEDLSFNTAISFITNTNWQNYGGESTLSYLVADARADAPEFPVGGNRHRTRGRADPRLLAFLDAHRRQFLGRRDSNHPLCPAADLRRLHPVSWFGRACRRHSVPMSTPRRWKAPSRPLRSAPVASQVAIKMLGTNGGGFFNANAAHPFENPTALSNFVQMISIFAIGASLTNVFGRMVGNQKQGWAILGVMAVLFISGVTVTYWAEANGTTAMHALGLAGGNMEGKEVRFGNRRLLAVRGGLPRRRPAARSMPCMTRSPRSVA